MYPNDLDQLDNLNGQIENKTGMIPEESQFENVVNTIAESVIITEQPEVLKSDVTGKRYKYAGMSDLEVEYMMLEQLPREMITLENTRLYMFLFRKMHELLNISTNLGDAIQIGACKLSFMLDYIEKNPDKEITNESLLLGSQELEIAEAESKGCYDTHLHDLQRLTTSDNCKNMNALINYYLMSENTDKYRNMRGELSATNILEAFNCIEM